MVTFLSCQLPYRLLQLVDYVHLANAELHFVQANTPMAATLLQLLNKWVVLGLGTSPSKTQSKHRTGELDDATSV